MKDVLLALSIIWCSQSGFADCSTWNLFGAGSPPPVDGHAADYAEMAQAQLRTRAYIERLEQTIAQCRLDEWQRGDLIDAMKSAARRYNRALAAYRAAQWTAVAQSGGGNNQLE